MERNTGGFSLYTIPVCPSEHHLLSDFTAVGNQLADYLFLCGLQTIPHGRHDLRHFPKAGTGVLSLDGCLRVSEEQGVC